MLVTREGGRHDLGLAVRAAARLALRARTRRCRRSAPRSRAPRRWSGRAAACGSRKTRKSRCAAEVAAHVGGVAARRAARGLPAWRRCAARVASSLASKITASLRKGSIRWSGIDGDRAVVQRSAAHARRQLDGAGRRRPAAPTRRRARPPVFSRHQHLARVDQVRVADLVEVHAPQLGPAPRALQEELGDVPQRVAALDGVASRARWAPAPTAARRPAPPAARCRAAAA